MDFDLILLRGYWAFVCFVGCVFFYQRYRWRRNRRRGRIGFYPSTASMGNALHRLQVIAEPQTKHVVVEMQEEETDDEDAGGPDDPVRHLHRQAAKIRRRERLDRSTSLLGRPE